MATRERAESEIDMLFPRVRMGDRRAFAQWMGRVERPIRMSLARFARAVDVEAIVQETLLRMWVLASRHLRELAGENASLRFAIGLARNLARSEARRMGRLRFLPPEDVPEIPAEPAPTPDPGLAAAIRDCMGRLTAKLRQVLQARIVLGPLQHDRDIAIGLKMKTNTFLQNVVRARQQMRKCLERKGAPMAEITT